MYVLAVRRVSWIAVASCLAVCSATGAADAPPERAESRPNILWITCEDMSATLGCYGDAYATTPHLDRFARGSVRYTRAFASAPVCSPARSCLITGLFATSLGTQHLRSAFPIPQEFQGYPTDLRAAGYYCTNNEKTDYNTANERAIIAASWDECSGRAHYRNRRPDQPFFSVFNLMVTHQSRTSAWPYEQFEQLIQQRLKPAERHDPAQAPIPPFYPDTPIVRRTVARYYDCVTAMDKEVGALLDRLDAQGLADDTIVFFFSDHGMGMPRGKRTLYDSGLHVPLLIRFPKKYQHLAPAGPGETVGRLVGFVDFAPTLLSLAGVEIPAHMQGAAFLGPQAGRPREYVYGARDRVDEAFDLARSVRDERYLYLRNYRPYLSWNQPETFSDTAELRQEITRLAAAGHLDASQLTYAGPNRPLEELYDTDLDPHQVRNLAGSADQQSVLERMRRQLAKWTEETRDLGFLPEADAWDRSAGSTPWEMAQDAARYPLREIAAAADLVGRDGAVSRQVELLSHSDPAVRFWAAVGLRAAGPAATAAREPLRQALRDPSAAVRVEAAGVLAGIGDLEIAMPVLLTELQGSQLDAALHAARTLQLLGKSAQSGLPTMKAVLDRAQHPPQPAPQYMFLQFSLQTAVEQLEHSPDH